MNFRRKIAIVALPAVLALAGGAIAVHAASTPNPVPPKAAHDAPDPTEATGTEAQAAAEKPETPEAPGAADVGHADPAGEVDNQSTGND